MKPWRILPLARFPELADTLADWHHAQWGELMAPWTHAEALAELRAHAAGGDCPTTLVALGDDDRLLGSVSLVLEDAPELKDIGPWLAGGLYVRPQARGQGIGAALVHALVAHSARRRHRTLYLFTDQTRWYQSLGWQLHARLRVSLHEVDVLTINVRRAQT
ncbi:MAG: GNAT family N-acetyltransferase [Lysobacterales bacterium]